MVSCFLNLANLTKIVFAGIFEEILLCFSLIRNTKQIMNTKVPIGAITSLNGMRVLSMWWVILGHTVFFMVLSGNLSKYS